MYLKIESTASVFDDHSLIVTPFYTAIKTDLYDEETDEYNEIELGHIRAYRFDLDYPPTKLAIFGDDLDADLSRVAEFFFHTKIHRQIYNSKYIFYIHHIFIQPDFRGKGYALQALALFLELFAKREVVSCYPLPMDDLKDKYSQTKGKLIMRKYWSKLGLTYYSKKYNILWQDRWLMPDWLKTKVLKSL